MIQKLLLLVRSLLLFFFNSSEKAASPNSKLLCLGMFFVVSFGFSQTTYYSRSTGNWNSNTTWSVTSGGSAVPAGVYPGPADVVFIEGGFNVTLNANAACTSISFPVNNNNNNTLTLAGFTLTVSGNITIPRANNGGSGYKNLIAVGTGNLNAGSISFTNAGSTVRHEITLSTGTVTVTNDITSGDTSGSITFTGAGILKVGGAMFLPANGTLTTFAGSTVEYNGGAQNVSNFTYSNLTLSGSGTKSIATSMSAITNLTVSGTAVLSPNAVNRIPDTTKLILNGGSYSTGGFSETMGTLSLNDNSTLALGAGNHTIKLSASSGVTWTPGKTLTITGWTGAYNSSGKIIIGNSDTSLTTQQLAQIKFQVGAENRAATILATGEIVPAFCPFTGNTQSGGLQSICYDSTVRTNTGGVIFSAVPVDGYIAVNVIQGMQYRIATTGSDKTFTKRLTLFNGSNTTTALATTNASSATNAATIDWTANFTGVLYVVFNSANCQSSTAQDDITVSYIGGNNTTDSQTAYGTDSWIGHVYNFSDSAGVSPLSDVDAFGNYLGYFNQSNTVSGTTISFNNDYKTSTSTTTCFPFVAGSTSQSFYTETFAVKYRMRSSLTGCYLVNVDGDDGVRLTVDGVKILDAWVQQSSTPYANVLIYLDATKNGGTGSELLFEYYEKNGNNVSNFRMIPFDSGTNTVVAPTPAAVCSGITPGLINGSAYTYNGSTVNPTIKFQWQTATNFAGPWSNVTGGTGATSEDYTPGAITTTGVVTNYYKRIVSAVASNAAACTWDSNIISITTSATSLSPGVPTVAPATIVSCTSFTANWGSIATATSYKLDVSTSPTFAAGLFVLNGTDVGLVNAYNLTGLTSGTTYYYRVRAFNGCSGNTSGNSGVQNVIPVSPTATISGTTTVCLNASSPSVVFTNPRSNAITVTYNINSGTNATINVPANTTATVAAPTSVSGPFVYNLVSVVYQSAPTCLTSLSGSVTVTVNQKSADPSTASAGSATICNGGSTTLTLNGGGGGTGEIIKWYSASCGGTLIGTGNGLSVSPTVTTTYFGRYEDVTPCNYNSACASVTITVNQKSADPSTASAGSAAICNGGSTTLTLNGGGGGTGEIIKWYSASCGGTLIGTGNGLSVSPTVTTTYFGRYEDGTPCNYNSACASVTVTVNQKSADPSTASAGSAAICNGGSTTLTLNGGGGGTGEIIKWYSASCGGTLIGTGNGLSVSPTVTTTYFGRYEDGTPCNYNSACASVTVTVNPLPTITAQPQPLTICENQNGSFTISTSAATPTYLWEYSTNGSAPWLTTNGIAGVGGYNTSTLTLTGTPLNYGGNYVRCTVTSGGCSTVSNAVQLIVNPNPTAPTASVTTQPTCGTPTGTITVSSPAPGTGISYSINGSNYSNTSGVFINVAPNNIPYNVTTKNSTGCISPATTVTVNNPSGKMWNGSVSTDWLTSGNWTPSGVPGTSDCVIIPSTGTKPIITSVSPVTVYSVTVNSGGLLTVKTKGVLTVNDGITVANGGDLVFEDDSSLLQTSTSTTINSGDITYKRISSPVRRYDFTFWSTPVTRTPTAYKLADVSPLTLFDKYYSYSPGAGWVISYSGILPMTPGFGYIIRAPQDYDINNALAYPATFIGTPNNGTIQVPGAISGKSILLGNPYPSGLNATKFISDNQALLTDVGTLYFWTHNSPPSNTVLGDAKYNYTTADYAAFNLTGPVGTKAGTDTGNNAPTGIIAAGQAFFIRATSNKVITFTNAMREGPANDQFFKTAKANDEGKNRLWLNLTNNEGAFKQALIGYLDGATNNWDPNYDGLTLNGNSYLDFYSVNGTQKLTIQGRAMPFDTADLVPLGYISSIAGDFTIAIDHADGLFDTQAVYLEDKTTGKTIDLRAGNYTFTTAIGTFTDRFVLSYANKTLGTGDFENVENGLLVAVKDKAIKVTSSKETIKEVTIFDTNGKLLYNKKKIGTTEWQVSNLQAADQILLVKVTLENEFTTTRKIVFH